MMKKKYWILSLIGAFALLLNPSAFTNSGGAPGGSSGSPASNGNTCARSGCHSGGPAQSNENVTITTDIPTAGFEENTNYSITVNANDGGRNLNTIAFQASVESASGHEGTVAVSNASTTRKIGNYITHTFSGKNASGGQNSWSFDWNSGTAPDQTTVYTAVNFANGNGGTSGDVIVSQSLALTKSQGIGLEAVARQKVALYPNPATDQLTVATQGTSQEPLKIYNLTGQKVLEAGPGNKVDPHHWQINIEGLAAGTYLLKTAEGQTIQFQKK